jgi:hypothetical protein
MDCYIQHGSDPYIMRLSVAIHLDAKKLALASHFKRLFDDGRMHKGQSLSSNANKNDVLLKDLNLWILSIARISGSIGVLICSTFNHSVK